MFDNYNNLLVEQTDNNLLIVKLNRPKALNALSFELLTELNNLLDNISANKKNPIKGLIITGENKAFCAGADINQLAELDTTTGYQFAKMGQSVFNKLENLTIPTVAAINGYTFGGGCELAIATHVRIGSEQAQFGQPEVKLGVIPGYGGTQRLARIIGKGRALDLCLSGRFIDSKTALDWGLITNLTTQDKLLEFSIEYLTNMCSLAPLALQSVISSINHGYELSMTEALELEALHFAKTCGTNDKKIGVDAFLNKKTPEFEGN